jgi:hypothetical protein
VQRPGCQHPIYTAEFNTTLNGQVFIFINDAIFSWPGLLSWRSLTEKYYDNDQGKTEVLIEPVGLVGVGLQAVE